MVQTAAESPRLRVMHVASGGFSGATQVALELTRAPSRHERLLVLRRKRHTPMDRVDALRRQGIPLELVSGWSHLATVLELRALCGRWQPDVVVGHGFPEHLLARWGGLWAPGGPPALVQVEHNMRERYTPFKRWQAQRLERHTAAFIGVSRAVASTLLTMGLPAERVDVVRNGIDLQPFAQSEDHPWSEREPAILMAARFGAQKDHLTLIRALPLLHQRHGMRPALRLAGGGSATHRRQAEELARALGLEDQVHFLGHRPDLPQMLMRHQVAALSTHYEGLPLSLAEAMAAGCAVVGSDVDAVRETLLEEQAGWLAPPADAQGWADVLAAMLRGGPDVLGRIETGRHHARRELSRQRMVAEHEALYERVAQWRT